MAFWLGFAGLLMHVGVHVGVPAWVLVVFPEVFTVLSIGVAVVVLPELLAGAVSVAGAVLAVRYLRVGGWRVRAALAMGVLPALRAVVRVGVMLWW
ncbi:MAG: hypothetical protein JNG84_14905 [Archangium sp.]|nr:hypothetical protein [Archangium sp.]